MAQSPPAIQKNTNIKPYVLAKQICAGDDIGGRNGGFGPIAELRCRQDSKRRGNSRSRRHGWTLGKGTTAGARYCQGRGGDLREALRPLSRGKRRIDE